MLFLQWCLSWSSGETLIKPLVKLKTMLLNIPSMAGDQMNYNYIQNNKIDAISDIVFPKITMNHVSL